MTTLRRGAEKGSFTHPEVSMILPCQPLQNLLCHYSVYESFSFVEATFPHLDSTIVISQQQRAEPSIRLSLTDITHLITGKLKENMQRGIAFPPLSSLKQT